MNAILHNPWHYTGAIVARLAANGATIIWSVVVLWSDDMLAGTSYGNYLTSYAHEDVWALFFLSLSSFMLYRIIRPHKPHPIGIVGYGIIGGAWLYVDVVVLFFAKGLAAPETAAWVTVGTVLAIYGFVANPRTCANVAPG